MLTTVMSRIDMMAPRTTTPAILRTAASSLSGCTGAAGGAVGEDTDGSLLGGGVWTGRGRHGAPGSLHCRARHRQRRKRLTPPAEPCGPGGTRAPARPT